MFFDFLFLSLKILHHGSPAEIQNKYSERQQEMYKAKALKPELKLGGVLYVPPIGSTNLKIMSNKTLIVIDYQKEYTDKNSEYYVGDVSDKIGKLNKLIKNCRDKNILIIFVIHEELGSEDAFKSGSKNVEIMDGVDFKKEQDILIKKNKISAFYKTSLEEKLKDLGVNELIVTGILTNLCVRSCVSDAYDRDFKITVITDTCAALSEEIHNFTIDDLEETRSEIRFIRAEEIIL